MPNDIKLLMPSDKMDTARAEELVSFGYPTVVDALPSIIEWIQDLNWPVARVLRPFLAEIGAPLAPHVLAVLKTNDETWKWSVLNGVVAHSRELAESIRPELERLAEAPTPSEVHEELNDMARQIVADLSL